MSQHPPPPAPPPYPQGWPAPAGPPPPRRRTGLTLALLGAGLVVVLMVIGIVALFVNEGSKKPDDQAGGAHEASCEVYADVVLSSELWSATEFDPDKLQEMYDAALADITDDEVGGLVEEESAAVVSYYRALAEWKQSVDDAVARGEYPDSAVPAEVTAQQAEIPRTQAAVAGACSDVLPGRGDEPAPRVTAPTLQNPSPSELGAP